MKQQYFADLRDCVKYSILRNLLNQGISCTVCWMLTQCDNTQQGRLKIKERHRRGWRDYDPDIFDYLLAQMNSGVPYIYSINCASPIEDCRFYWKRFPPSSTRRWEEYFTFRKAYFDGCLRKASGTSLVFLDPDIGPEPNKPVLTDLDGYVLWDEIARIFCAGHSVIVFNFLQGGTNQKNDLVAKRSEELRGRLPTASVYALRAHELAFYFVVHQRHHNAVEQAREAILARWGPTRLWQAI